MKHLIISVLFVAMTSCMPHTYNTHSDVNGMKVDNDTFSSRRRATNDSNVEAKQPSTYERCMERNRGSDNASDLCNAYVEAGMPCVGKSCQETTTYGYYGY